MGMIEKNLNMEELRNMELHEIKECRSFSVMRVYKGWIYTIITTTNQISGDRQVSTSSVFISK